MIYHILALMIGYILDLLVGDPYTFPHPVRVIGTLIGKLDVFFLGKKGEESQCKKTEKQKKTAGLITVITVCFLTVLVVNSLLTVSYKIHPFAGLLVEAVMTYYMLATKCLKDESMKVFDKLQNGTLEEARFAVSMIVGRDTLELDQLQVARAAVETVAENTSDGIVAPMLYLAIGGPVLGFWYKAINTMDSMIAYKNDRYMSFGFYAARLDDIVNFIPSRISALLMIVSCRFLGKDYDEKEAKRIWLRDRFQHASPNSAQTESTLAGALGLRLAGPTSYFGKLHQKPYIGDEKREIEFEDIKRANKLLYATSFLSLLCCEAVLVVIFLIQSLH